MWDAEEDLFDHIGSNYTDDEAHRGKYFVLHEPASAIRLARQFNIPEILPAAFHHLSRISSDKNWLARRLQTAGIVSSHYYPAYSRTARWDLVSSEDFGVLLRGREQIEAFITNVWAPTVAYNCSSKCVDQRRYCQMNMYSITSLCETAEDETTFLDPLRMLRRNFDRDIDTIRQTYFLYEACATEIRQATLVARKRLLELLPEFFGLEENPLMDDRIPVPDFFYDSSASSPDLCVWSWNLGV